MAQNVLGGSFLTEYYRMVAEWADWAKALVERWPGRPGRGGRGRGAFQRVVGAGGLVGGRSVAVTVTRGEPPGRRVAAPPCAVPTPSDDTPGEP